MHGISPDLPTSRKENQSRDDLMKPTSPPKIFIFSFTPYGPTIDKDKYKFSLFVDLPLSVYRALSNGVLLSESVEIGGYPPEVKLVKGHVVQLNHSEYYELLNKFPHNWKILLPTTISVATKGDRILETFHHFKNNLTQEPFKDDDSTVGKVKTYRHSKEDKPDSYLSHYGCQALVAEGVPISHVTKNMIDALVQRYSELKKDTFAFIHLLNTDLYTVSQKRVQWVDTHQLSKTLDTQINQLRLNQDLAKYRRTV
jgi:hypothetical protein